MTDVDALGVLALVNVLVLLVTSALLVYPVVRHARNVAHGSGFVALAVAFVLLTAAATDVFFFGRALRNSVLALLASVAALAGTWVFARPFVPRLGRSRVDAGVEGATSEEQPSPEVPAFEGRFDGGDGE